ncbi:MAG: exopolysaccharide biosynthesis polyprenyl glycosylphosphotransferase, partial [candidate division Zixibacteria bacterium]|nr:exopolysaccharide biosynthesis polyprenyl glycosylphosphotransferase [candidate division Zixibacteria bacterium]
MGSYKEKIILRLSKITDILIFLLSIGIVALMISVGKTGRSVLEFMTMRIQLQNLILLFGMSLIWYFIFSVFKLYEPKRLSRQLDEIVNTIKATSIGAGFIWVMGVLFSISVLKGMAVFWFWLFSTSITVFVRMTLRWLLKRIVKSGKNIRNVLVIGTNSRAKTFAEKIGENRELGYSVAGFLDDLDYTPDTPIEIMGRLDDFSRVIRESVVDEVFVFLPVKSYYDRINEITVLSEEQGITVRFSSDLFNLRVAKSRADNFDEMPMTTLYSVPPEGVQTVIKEFMDFVISGICLILFLPVFLVIALAIKLDSRGPVFFVQERVGLSKRRFKLLKFRTMVNEAEEMQAELEHLNEMDGAVFKIKGDPRVTFVGRILRRTSLDELPQLVNVLKGDMSLVGPRP